MAAADHGPAFLHEFEEARKELLERFLDDMLDLYTAYDEIQDGQTLVVSIDLTDEPEITKNEELGFSSN